MRKRDSERVTICELAYKAAVEAIKDVSTVYYRRGVWNEYRLMKREQAQKAIMASGYGADVFLKDGMYYVSVPCDSDMW